METLIPPESAIPGERIYFENYEDGVPDVILNPKKKIWEKLQEDLKTDETCVAVWQGNKLIIKSGDVVRSKTMVKSPIK